MNAQTLVGILIIVLSLLVMLLVGAPTSANNISTVAVDLADGRPGAATAGFILDKAIGVAIGIVITGIIGGIGAFVFSLARNAWEERKKGDWQPGPNANFARRAPRQPTVTRDEMYQLALLNALSNGNPGQFMPQITTTNQTEEAPPAEF